MDKFDQLTNLFLDWNSKINLSAIRDKEQVEVKHIKDSLEWAKILKNLVNKNSKIVDIWTWSWFPLLPLAISFPDLNFTWIESVRKKVNAVNDIIEKLNLKNVKVIWTRAEDYKKEKFDILTARAVAYIDKLMKYSYHLVKNWWYFVLFKLNSKDEYNDLLKVAKKYNLKLILKHDYKLFPDDVERVIYVLEKLAK